MATLQVAVRYEGQKGTATIKTLGPETFLVFKTTAGEHVKAISLDSISDVQSRNLRSRRPELTFNASGDRHIFKSIKNIDNSWNDLVWLLASSSRPLDDESKQSSPPTSPLADYPLRPLAEEQTAAEAPSAKAAEAPSAKSPVAEPQTACAVKLDTVPLRLLDLPQELLDMIFDLAYPQQHGAKFVSPRDLQRRRSELVKQGKDVPHAVEFTPKVCEFMVSKKFFLDASKAWVHNQVIRSAAFDTSAFHNALLFPVIENPYIRGGIVAAFATKVILEAAHHLSYLKLDKLPSLVDLTVTVGEHAFEALEPRLAWVATFEDRDFEKLMQKSRLYTFRGLKYFRLVPGSVDYAKTDEQRARFRANVKAWEAFALPIVTRPRLPEVQRKANQIFSTLWSPPRRTKAARLATLDATPPGISITANGLLMSQEAFQSQSFYTVQAFLLEHRCAVLEEMKSKANKGDVDNMTDSRQG